MVKAGYALWLLVTSSFSVGIWRSLRSSKSFSPAGGSYFWPVMTRGIWGKLARVHYTLTLTHFFLKVIGSCDEWALKSQEELHLAFHAAHSSREEEILRSHRYESFVHFSSQNVNDKNVSLGKVFLLQILCCWGAIFEITKTYFKSGHKFWRWTFFSTSSELKKIISSIWKLLNLL